VSSAKPKALAESSRVEGAGQRPCAASGCQARTGGAVYSILDGENGLQHPFQKGRESAQGLLRLFAGSVAPRLRFLPDFSLLCSAKGLIFFHLSGLRRTHNPLVAGSKRGGFNKMNQPCVPRPLLDFVIPELMLYPQLRINFVVSISNE
jgi:hypothetical protein